MSKGGFEEDGVQPAKAEKKSSLDREIQVKINPSRVGKVGLFIVIVLAVFFLGRWSANNFELTGLVTSDAITAPKEVPTEKEVQKEELAVEEETVVEEEPEIKEKSDEAIIDTYKNTKITINAVEVDWKETWGKITALDVSIQNDEEGTILPGHILIMVEGYKDVEKEATLPEEAREISSSETFSGKVSLDKPFNYNEATAGRLDSVKVRAILFNTDNKPMASYEQEFNLKR